MKNSRELYLTENLTPPAPPARLKVNARISSGQVYLIADYVNRRRALCVCNVSEAGGGENNCNYGD